MTFDDFKALHWRDQNALIEPELLAVLGRVRVTLSTESLVAEICRRQGWPDRQDDARFLAYVLVRRFAKRGEPIAGLATHDGEEVAFWGKVGRRWRWHPIVNGAPTPLERGQWKEPAVDLFS